MKTKLIIIPSGCKRVDVDHENGVVVMHIEDEVVQFEKGELVLMRDDVEQIWMPKIFHSKSNYFYSIDLYGDKDASWNQCAKYTPELMGTKNEPK